MSQTGDGKADLQRGRKAPSRTPAGKDRATGPPKVFAPRPIWNPKTGKQAIVDSEAELARWARTWRLPVKTLRQMALERTIPLVAVRANYSADRLPVDTTTTAVNDSAPPTVADFHVLVAQGDVWLVRSELPDGSHRFSLSGIDERVIEQSYTLADRAGRSFLDSSADPFRAWATEVWIFHARRADLQGTKDRRSKSSIFFYADVDGALVPCHSESLDGFCAVSADLLGGLVALGSRNTAVARGGRPRAHVIHSERVRELRGEKKQRPFARALRVSLKVLQRAENQGYATDATILRICRLAKRRGLELKPEDLKKNTPQEAS